MRLLRTCLLVFLAVLLPVRGAMAVGMACAPASGGAHIELRSMDRAVHDHAQAGGEAMHEHGDAAADEHEASNQDKCNLCSASCSASCSATPLMSDIAGIAEPRDRAGASFPGFSAPAPSFLSDGQERPPRSI